MSDDLKARRERLARLRSAMPKRLSRFERTPNQLEPRPSAQPSGTLEELLSGGVELQSDAGPYYLVGEAFEAGHVHGDDTLGRLTGQGLAGAATFMQEPRLAELGAADCVFLDTETTGLSQGAGTLVFMVGIGWVTAQGVEVRQYFLRDPGEEVAMLTALDEAVQGKRALVTFNGRHFDVPLLAGRYRLNRIRSALTRLPNLDLLLPARRLWRRRVGSCALGSLEQSILGVQRTGKDIPGALIPQVYNDYLHSGDARDIVRVFYHNQIDILSMVMLLARQLAIFDAPEGAALPAQDWLSLARYYERVERMEQAESAYRTALDGDLPDDDARFGFDALGVLLRRAERRAEAVEVWMRWASRFPDDPAPCIEIAKHYEWHDKDLSKAQEWAAAAYGAMAQMSPGPAQERARYEIEYRLTRLACKLEKT